MDSKSESSLKDDGSDEAEPFDYMAEAADEASDELLRAALLEQRAMVLSESPARTSSLKTGITDEFAAMQIASPRDGCIDPRASAQVQKTVIEISDSPVAVAPKKKVISKNELAARMACLKMLQCSGL